MIDGTGSVTSNNNAAPSTSGSSGASPSSTSATPAGPTPASLISDNTNKFGLDARSLAADMSGMPASQQKTVIAGLTPVQQGEVKRALDSQAPKVPDPMGITAVLGQPIAGLAAQSPSLMAGLAKLEAAGFKVKLATSSNTDGTTININRTYLSDPSRAVSSLAHEVGHALNDKSPDPSSKAAYVKTLLAGEGAATMMAIRVGREIKANGGPDIGINSNGGNEKRYNEAYDRYLSSGNEALAREEIGEIYRTGEKAVLPNTTYEKYYGDWYDKNYPATK